MKLLLTAGNVNNIVGVRELLKDLPDEDYLLTDKRCGADYGYCTRKWHLVMRGIFLLAAIGCFLCSSGSARGTGRMLEKSMRLSAC
ncbi:MAG: hypothetical protein LBD34_01515 [Puniceicoccales bacterium]|nr:hypothetical protein [Puniceicoccales bacterium]